MIYTSYYARYAKMPQNNNTIAVQVSNSQPQWFDKPCVSMKELAPTWELVQKWKNRQVTEEEFKQMYIQELDCRVNKDEVIAKLMDLLREYDVVVLLCYEKYGDVCHRYSLAEWLDLGIKEMPY